VRAVTRHLAPVAGAPGVEPLALVADRVDERLARLVGFEVPLHDDDAGADLFVHLPEPARLADAALSAPLGRDAADLARLAALGTGGQAGHRAVCDAWLEWDVASGSAARPSVFVRPDPGDRRRPDAIVAVASALTGRGAWTTLPADVARVLGALPKNAVAEQVGAMLGRAEPGVRLCIGAADPERLAEAIPAAGWPGDLAALRALLVRYAPLAAWVVLALDLVDGGGVGPQVGVELAVAPPADPGPLLARLAEDGLATARRAAGVAAYPGQDAEPQGADWPAGLTATRALLGDRVRSAVVRGVNHVKVTQRLGAPTRAKAYLGARALVVAPAGA
jgi:hypothetical protein